MATFTKETSAETEFKNNKDISIKDHIITNTQNWEENGYPSQAKGAPLSWFMNASDGPEEETSTTTTPCSDGHLTNGPTLEEPVFMSEEIKTINPPSYIINQDVKETVEIKEKEPEAEQYQPPLRTSTNPSSDSESGIENRKSKLLGGWDPESDEAWDRKFLKRVVDEKLSRQKELQIIESQRQELEVEKQQIEQMRCQIAQQINDLNAKTAEVELLLPLARQLLEMNVDVTSYIPWNEMVVEYATARKMDTTTAAFDIASQLRAFKDIKILRNIIKDAKEDVEAIAACRTLRAMRYKKKDIYDLVKVISA